MIFLTNKDIEVQGYQTLHISNIDEICDGECHNIYMDHGLINTFPFYHLKEIMDKILAKLAYGGSITIQGVDINLLMRSILWNDINKEEQNMVIQECHNAIGWHDIKLILDQSYKVSNIKLDKYNFIMEIVREQQ